MAQKACVCAIVSEMAQKSVLEVFTVYYEPEDFIHLH